jgi:hypothetical protein
VGPGGVARAQEGGALDEGAAEAVREGRVDRIPEAARDALRDVGPRAAGDPSAAGGEEGRDGGAAAPIALPTGQARSYV